MYFQKININNFILKFSFLIFFSISYLIGNINENIFFSLILNQTILIFVILFYYNYNFWSLTSQFQILNLAYQLLPYLVDYNIYNMHGLIIFLLQISSIIVFEKIKIISPFIVIKKNKKNIPVELKFSVLAIILFINYMMPFKFALQVDFALLAIMLYTILTCRYNLYVNISFFLILIFLLINSGFLGGDRRFFIYYLIIIFLFISHLSKFKFGNLIFIFAIPIILILFYFQGLFRVFGFDEGLRRLLRLNITTLNSFFENIDIGVFSRIYESLFVGGLYSHIKDAYLTGFSFERVFYLFIPRQIWPDKPENLSTIAGEYAYPGNSAPISLPMEFYVNFGIWFCPFIFLIFSKLLLYLDKQYNNSERNFMTYYFFLVSFFIVIYRGSIETDLIIFSAFFIAIFTVYQFILWNLYRTRI